MSVVQLYPQRPARPEPTPFRLGVNYWPGAKGVTLWKNFDIDEVHGDMATIAELGLDVIRVFLLWEDFQPEPEGVNCCALARLTGLCDAVAAEGLKVIVTLFTGHLSGHNWAPLWLLDEQSQRFDNRPVVSKGQRVQGGYRNPVSDPVARKAALRLVRAVGRTLSDHQAVWAYDLGNVPDLFAQASSPAVARDWYIELAGALRNLDANHALTCGLGEQSLYSDHSLRVDDACVSSTFSSIQVFPSELALARTPLDADLLPFSCALASALSGKPCLASEWGLSTAPPGQQSTYCEAPGARGRPFLASEHAAADHAEKVLPKLVATGALGALLGNYSDFDPAIFDRPPYDTFEHERCRGLVRADGSLKPHGQVIRRFAESNPPVQTPPTRRAAVDVSNDDFYSHPLKHTLRFYESFVAESSHQSPTRNVKPSS